MSCPTHQLDNLMRRAEYINRQTIKAPENDDWLNEPFHGEGCLRRSVEDHEIAMGRACSTTRTLEKP